jgi:metal-sulfur cluster biosynthetic enzyme
VITEEQVKQQLLKVEDPEIHIDIINLGLIYGIDIADEKVTVRRCCCK